ncbi:UNVERIFIED_CONTAM: hypothetical protein HDU68_012815 [Siphonaria sp. JEL0065]|nr:hypothetical protein HDU68_012815 [Siphonaria sp. JEL0065]
MIVNGKEPLILGSRKKNEEEKQVEDLIGKKLSLLQSSPASRLFEMLIGSLDAELKTPLQRTLTEEENFGQVDGGIGNRERSIKKHDIRKAELKALEKKLAISVAKIQEQANQVIGKTVTKLGKVSPKKSLLIKRKEECARNIRDLPEVALRENISHNKASQQLLAKLRKVNEKFKKRQSCEQEGVRTFKQVTLFFSEVWRKLVLNGREYVDSMLQNADAMEVDNAPEVSAFLFGISVSFAIRTSQDDENDQENGPESQLPGGHST